MGLPDLTEEAVLRAIAEFDALGRDVFLKKYGFGRSRGYFIVHEDRPYDSKAIAGAAHGYVGSGRKPLQAAEFSGGDKAVANRLRDLGFSVSEPPEVRAEPVDARADGVLLATPVRTWIFQGNPDQFDIDGYLASRPARFVWLVTRHAEDMRPGDRVFIWRTGGEARTGAGVIAEAEIIGSPEPRPEEPEALPYWRTNLDRRNGIVPRARLRLLRVASRGEVLMREWCQEDPVLRDLPNLKMAAGTNYRIEPKQAERLVALWSRFGRGWTRNELVAGLWGYVHAYGQPASGSIVAEVALTLGRTVGAVQNKIMNFRAIDARAGQSGGGPVDLRVWGEFYDEATRTLRVDALEREFTRLWRTAVPSDAPLSDIGDQDAVLEAQANKLAESDLGLLLEKYRLEREARPARPNARNTATRTYERSPLVVAIARLRTEYRCEAPECAHPTFVCADGTPYTEVHHIKPLSEGGEDVLENVACLCAAHHREIHVGRRAVDLATELRQLILKRVEA